MDAGRSEVLGTGKTQDAVSIREIAAGDAEGVAQLSGELGYPVAPETMKQRIEELLHLKDHVVYVACTRDRALGWIDVGIVHHLQDEPCAEIGGLVVDSEFRGRGIGALLVAKAEQWAAEQRMRRMRVRSRIEREATHRFYLRLNYSRIKTSAVFVKML